MQQRTKHHDLQHGTSSGKRLGKYFSAFKEQPDEDSKNRARVFSVVLTGTLFVAVIVWLLLFVSFALLNNSYVLGRVVGASVAVGFLLLIALTAYRFKKYTLAAWFLLMLYAAIASAILWFWGINTPFGILFFGVVVILAGILVRAHYALYAAGAAFVLLSAIQVSLEIGHHKPNDAWSGSASTFGDVLAYSAGFVLIAIISWLYGRQMERSLHKAVAAEQALQAQKENLERIVKQRTAALEQTQLEEMEQMYRLTQVGSLSTGLLHDLANYLTVLTLDIENLRSKTDSATLDRTRHTISYIDTMIEDVRSQLHGDMKSDAFNIIDVINDVTGVLQHKAKQARVTLDWPAPQKTKTYEISGDKTRFNQVMTTLICNAIDAYDSTGKDPVVHISCRVSKSSIVVSVLDHGKGIPDAMRGQLFKTFGSTKHTGMGIGLFLAKQIVEMHLKGSLALDPSHDHTLFVITLPALRHEKQ